MSYSRSSRIQLKCLSSIFKINRQDLIFVRLEPLCMVASLSLMNCVYVDTQPSVSLIVPEAINLSKLLSDTPIVFYLFQLLFVFQPLLYTSMSINIINWKGCSSRKKFQIPVFIHFVHFPCHYRPTL